MYTMKPITRVGLLGLAIVTAPRLVLAAHGSDLARGDLLSASVTVDGRRTPLYRSPDGSGRWYLEALEGSHYCLHLKNLTSDRLGILVKVDGLNVISGNQQVRASHRPGRLYVLDAWRRMSVRGWRTSLDNVRQFTFEDEDASYAVRSGQANAKLGWIEIDAYRERLPEARVTEAAPPERRRGARAAGKSRDRAAAPSAASDEGRARQAMEVAPRHRSYPGTGWGERVRDRAVVVDFEPRSWSAERLVLRYEYREALLALGVLPDRPSHRGRLWQRDRADQGFARPPE